MIADKQKVSDGDPVAAALAWCNQPLMVVGDGELLNALAVARMHAANLAAEVRRLQSNQTMQVGLLEACEDLGVQLEAAKRRQQQAEADRDSAVALYGVQRADWRQAEAEVRRLQAEVANWQRKELIRGSCCADNEQRALQAEAALVAEPKQVVCECPAYEAARARGGYPSGICRDCGCWYPGKRKATP